MSEFNLTKALKAVKNRRSEMGEEPDRPTRGMADPNSPQSRIARARQLEHQQALSHRLHPGAARRNALSDGIKAIVSDRE